jgi:hypothetical protein
LHQSMLIYWLITNSSSTSQRHSPARAYLFERSSSRGKLMRHSERDSASENVRAAVAWLSARYVGATLVEFVQKLPTEEAEKVHAAALELKRLKAEDERHAKAARDIQLWSWVGGVAGVAAIDAVLRGSIATGLLFIIDGVIVAAIWWFASRAIRHEYSLAGAAITQRFRIEESVFKRIGVVYREAEGTVHSVARLAASHEKIQQGLRDSLAVYGEIQKGASLAREAGINPSLFQHRAYLLSQVLGGLPTEELLDHPDCERLFHEMNRLGLRDHTIEAILLRRTDADLPGSVYVTKQGDADNVGSREPIPECKSGASRIEVTPEMLSAGVSVLWASGAVLEQLDSDELLVRDIFLAMLGCLPSPQDEERTHQ